MEPERRTDPTAPAIAGIVPVLSLVVATAGLLIYVYLIGWVVTSVRLAAARLPSDLATSAFDGKQLFGAGLRTAFFMGLIFAGACVVAYMAAARNWAANGPDWHALIDARGIRRARRPLEQSELERQSWEDRRERALAQTRGRRAGLLASAAGLVRVAPAVKSWAESRRDRASAIADAESPAMAARARRLQRRSRTLHALGRRSQAEALAKEAKKHERAEGGRVGSAPPASPPVPPPLGDHAVQVLAGFNVLVISAVIGLAAGRLVDLIPWAPWLTLLVGGLVAFAVWSALTHWGPLLARPAAHGIAWMLVAATTVLVAAPLGLLVIGSVAVCTLGRPLTRRATPRSLSELLRSPLPWALLTFYALVGVAYYATPPVSFQRAVLTTSGGELVGGYLSRSSAGVYLVSCTPLADATSTDERVDLIPANTIRRVTLGGPETRLDSGERPSLATLGLSALGVQAHVGSLIHADLRARHGTCGGAQPASLTGAEEDAALGAGVIVGPPPPGGRAHDGEPPIETKPTPAPIAKLARLYQPTIEVSVADRFWPVSVGAVLRDVGRGGGVSCIVRYPSRECKALRELGELRPQGSDRRDFLRFPARRESDPSNQFRAFLNGQYIFPGPDHRWLADPGLLHPWDTAQVYFFYAGPLSKYAWPGNARNQDVEEGLIGLEYWFFYPYNYYPTIISSALMDEAPIAGEHVNTDLHQGDWEHVTVLLDPKTFAPRWLYMARHADEGSFLPWYSPTLSFDGATHPIVQAAYGGHPTYDNHCGARPRGRVFYLSSDWVVCGGGRYAFRAGTTPLVDLAQTTWGCWKGFFGEATKWPKERVVVAESDNVVDKALELIYAPGPRSPLWQGENEKLISGHDVCVGERQRKPEEAAIQASTRAKLP